MNYMHSKENGWIVFLKGVGEFLLLLLMIAAFLPFAIIYIGCLGFGGRR